MRHTFPIAALAVALTGSQILPAQAQSRPDDGLTVVSSPASPRVAYTVGRENGNLVVKLSIESLPAPFNAQTIELAIAADKIAQLGAKHHRSEVTPAGTLHIYTIPASELVNGPEGWSKLRMAFSVGWGNGALNQPRQRETFLLKGSRAPHARISNNPDDWMPVNLVEFERLAADRKAQIAFDFEQPLDGKATIVIEDQNGNRVRNLLSGREWRKGKSQVAWDGRNDAGQVVPPGNYRWRSISHPGLSANYLFSFANAAGSNHGTQHSAATNGQSVFLGTSVSEGGYEIVQLTPQGAILSGFNAPHGHGLWRVAIAADEKYVYAVYDGTAWGQQIDRSKPDWKATTQMDLIRFNLENGQIVDYGKSRFAKLLNYEVGPGSTKKLPGKSHLGGMALLSGKLYIGDRASNQIWEVDAVTGEKGTVIPLPNVQAVAAGKDGLYAISGTNLVHVDILGKTHRTVATIKGQPNGLSVAPDGRFLVSDRSSHTVQILDKSGKQTGTLGKPGGITPGPYDPLKLKNPAGLTFGPDGHLWVTEEDRWQPKRYAAYDVASGKMWKEFFGPTSYGASGAGFDPQDSTRWIGQNTLFKLDFANKTATPQSILGGEDARHYRFWRQDGRTFVIGYDKATSISELKPDGTLKPLAILSSAHQFAYSRDWRPPAEFVAAFQRDYPNVKYTYGQRGMPGHGYGMLWVDQNGDGEMQQPEIEFATNAQNFAGSGWGHDFHDLTLRVGAQVDGKATLVTLKPQGYYAGGAPKYPRLQDAVAAGVPIDLRGGSVSAETTVDRFGNVLFNSSPYMTGFSPEGKLLWTYPNRWTGVHGSHAAPLPSPGELQGTLFYTGVAPLDDKADVTLLNGNHGRAFLLTTDGLYLDELFMDVRLMNNPQGGGIGILGGECFGGTFGRSETDGNYYFQGGGIEYRIYRVDGLKNIVRGGGILNVTADQIAAAERNHAREVAASAPRKSARIPVGAPPASDGRTVRWSTPPTLQWDKSGRFPVEVRAVRNAGTLYLNYVVRGDESPWVNNGKDWQQLFKTGDGVDLQLGTNPDANPARTSPVPGDLRLFVAPFQGTNIAVLYRHRQPGATDSVVFQSPWRSEKVDSVQRLDDARVTVAKIQGGYSVDIAIPLDRLGLNTVPAKSLRADFGVIYGDAEGTVNIFRNYWSNQATALVNDVPGEIMLTPNLWGDVTFAGGQP